jgi:hypothetical protein
MRRLAAAALLIAGCATTAPDPAKARAAYANLVDWLQTHDLERAQPPEVDYRQLRLGSALGQTAATERALAELDHALIEASAANRADEAERIALELLDKDVADVTAHLTRARALHDEGHGGAAGVHEALARGLYTSLLAGGGDGRSAARPLHVFGRREQQMVATLLGLTVAGTLAPTGHAGRQQLVCRGRGGEAVTLYFVVDAPAGAGAR